MKTYKLKIIKRYTDIALSRVVEIGEVLEVTENRALDMLKSPLNIAEVLEITEAKKEVKKEVKKETKKVAPKKTTKK